MSGQQAFSRTPLPWLSSQPFVHRGMAEDPGAHAEPLETLTANARRCLAPRSNWKVGRTAAVTPPGGGGGGRFSAGFKEE